jgi:hypothetical protein
MFGYVRPRGDLLEKEEFAAYRAAYCGLCRALGKQYGFRARFLVNYDMTFLYLLRASAAAPCETALCWCPARVCGRKRCTLDPESFGTVAACTVILSYEKLRDNVRDEGLFKSLPYRCLSVLFRRAYRKASRRLPDFAALCAGQLSALHELEAARSPSIDATADSFARIVSGCAADIQDTGLRRPMEQILYHTGRFLYLADALDDLKQDCDKDTYNPLRYRFQVIDGALSAEDLDYMTQLIDSSVNLAGAALELMPGKAYGKLLENIIYLGFPAVFFAVKAGKFQAKASLWKKKPKSETTGDTK